MIKWPWISRAHHEAVVALYERQIATLERPAIVASAVVTTPTPAPRPEPPAPPTFGKATELAILEQASGNKQLESHLRAVAQGLLLQEVEDVQIARTIRRCETSPRTIAQVVVEAASLTGEPEDTASLEDVIA